jgi:hypothetical protein
LRAIVRRARAPGWQHKGPPFSSPYANRGQRSEGGSRKGRLYVLDSIAADYSSRNRFDQSKSGATSRSGFVNQAVTTRAARTSDNNRLTGLFRREQSGPPPKHRNGKVRARGNRTQQPRESRKAFSARSPHSGLRGCRGDGAQSVKALPSPRHALAHWRIRYRQAASAFMSIAIRLWQS